MLRNLANRFHLGANVFTKVLALINQDFNFSSVLNPPPATITQPFIDFPVISKGLE